MGFWIIVIGRWGRRRKRAGVPFLRCSEGDELTGGVGDGKRMYVGRGGLERRKRFLVKFGLGLSNTC